MPLSDIFSEENVLAYSNACVNLAVDLPEYRNHQAGALESDTLVLPSRGAVPFFLGMIYAADKLKAFGSDQETFLKNLGIQETMAPLLPEGVNISTKVNEKLRRVLLIPFTADLNVSKFDRSLNDDELVEKTRRYWANVTKSFFRNPSMRRQDPYFLSFADFVLRDVEGRGELAEVYEKFPAIRSFSLMDTAISGRAATHILGSFDSLARKAENPNLIPNSFLVVDEDGKKLKPGFSRYLNKKRLEGMLSTYPIPRIVSEDQGASLLGVAAVIYPSIMRASRYFTLNGEEFFIGAGTWHNSSDLPGEYSRNFKAFMDMVYTGVDFLLKKDYSGESPAKEKDLFVESREAFLDRANSVRLLAPTSESVHAINSASNYTFEGDYETHSHVLHAPFTEDSERKFVYQLCHSKIPGLKYIGPRKEEIPPSK